MTLESRISGGGGDGDDVMEESDDEDVISRLPCSCIFCIAGVVEVKAETYAYAYVAVAAPRFVVVESIIIRKQQELERARCCRCRLLDNADDNGVRGMANANWGNDN
jgi:hypothetical protein